MKRFTLRKYNSTAFPVQAQGKNYSDVFASVEAAEKALRARFGSCVIVNKTEEE